MPARILHIDTSSPAALVMLAEDGMPLSWRKSQSERDHAAKLPGLVDEVLAEGKCPLAALDAIAVCSGPGSYTGLRIGLSAAKGFCYALEKPLILHNRLVLMLNELECLGADRAANRLAILPARVGEYFVAAQGEWDCSPTHISQADLLEACVAFKAATEVIGQWDDIIASRLNTAFFTPHDGLDGSVWAKSAYNAFLVKSFAEIAYAEPEYLKAAYVTASKKEK